MALGPYTVKFACVFEEFRHLLLVFCHAVREETYKRVERQRADVEDNFSRIIMLGYCNVWCILIQKKRTFVDIIGVNLDEYACSEALRIRRRDSELVNRLHVMVELGSPCEKKSG